MTADTLPLDLDPIETIRANVRWEVDSGHGWLLVNLHAYPQALDHADPYCYRSGDVVALEEDCAAGSFLDAHPGVLAVAAAHRLDVTRRDGDSPVRRWPRAR